MSNVLQYLSSDSLRVLKRTVPRYASSFTIAQGSLRDDLKHPIDFEQIGCCSFGECVGRTTLVT
jgi:hypothetical protein